MSIVSLMALFFFGGLVALVLTRASAGLLADPRLERENHRGVRLPTAAGLLLVVAVVAVEGMRVAFGIVAWGPPHPTFPRLLLLAGILGFGLLGLLDDVLGDGDDRGLRGHVRAAAGRRITTGLVKLGAGAALGLVLAGAADGSSGWRTLVDGALVALAANLANLLDRAPGRTMKVAFLCWVPLVLVAGTDNVGSAIAPLVGIGLVLLVGDVRERFMLGDTGANAIGAALGLTAVMALGFWARITLVVVLLALNLLSEVVSFSRVVDGFPPLRGLDRLGRPKDGA